MPSSQRIFASLLGPNLSSKPSKHQLADLNKPPSPRSGSGTSSPGAALLEIRAGPSAKPFTVHTELLTNRSPHFHSLLATTSNTPTILSFPDIPDPVFALFVRWLYTHPLPSPANYHTLNHHLTLYVLGVRFAIEPLRNAVLDGIRAYYRAANMTAPACRLEYAYAATQGPNPLRRFLVATAAYRLLCDPAPMQEDLRELLAKGGDLAVDFVECLVRLRKGGLGDVRAGSDCVFHEHVVTERCKGRGGGGGACSGRG